FFGLMSFPTLSYNQEESSTITSQVTASGSFLHTPSEELRTREFERDLKRHVSLDLHSITLAEYHKVQRIPRGLRVSLRPTLFHDNTDFCANFEAILNKCSMDLIVLTIDFLQKEITELSTRITTTEQQLSNTLSTEDFKTLKTKLDNTTSELRKNLQIKKRNTFLRNTEDYKNNQAYRWQSTGSFRIRLFARRTYSPISTSSDSDFGTTRSTFLEQRQVRPSRGKRGGRGDTGLDHHKMTRSQVLTPLKTLTLRLKAHFFNQPVNPTTEQPPPTSFALKMLNLLIPSSYQPPKTYHPVENIH
ncbi:unnamed protein product, partial [Ranitomeya imitator]